MQDQKFKMKLARFAPQLLLAALLAALVGCSDNTPSTPEAVEPGAVAVNSLQISASPLTVKTDNSDYSTVTVTAVDANNGAITGAVITLGANTGLLTGLSGQSTITTDNSGQATAKFSNGYANMANRTATVTATSGAATALMQIQLIGSTVALSSSTTSVSSVGISPASLTVTVKDAGGNPVNNAAVTLTQRSTDGGAVTITPAMGWTGTDGKLTVSVAGSAAGSVIVTANFAGEKAEIGYTVSLNTATFGISLLTLNATPGVIPVNPKQTAMQLGDSLAVQVTAPTSTSVLFATTIGYWNGVAGKTSVSVPVVAGKATATLRSASAGNATVQVLDGTGSPTDNLTVGITAKVPHHITLQASPVVVPKSVGSTSGFSTITAIVYDANNQPVGGLPVAFSIVSGTGTGSGESVSPVVVYTASSTQGGLALGAAPTTFTSGTLSSASAGVQVRATVVGTAIATQSLLVPNTTTSSFDAAIVVGGTAGSVAFGLATQVIDEGKGSTIYQYPMSVLVADSNGSPAPLGTVVNLSVAPIAWSTGRGCVVDADAAPKGTFLTEDANANLILDAGEDGARKFYASGVSTGVGTIDGQLTPLNSYGGIVVSTNPDDLAGTVTTDANGLASFYLTYTKASAIWVVSRIRAQTMVQGSPAVGQLDFRLVPSKTDCNLPEGICELPDSWFSY